MSSTPMIWSLGIGFEVHEFFLGLDEIEHRGVSLALVERAMEADPELATYHVCFLAHPDEYPENAECSFAALLDLIRKTGGAP